MERLNRREFTEIFEIKYFDRDAYLAQSPQFYKEHGVAGLVVRYQLSYQKCTRGLSGIVFGGPAFHGVPLNGGLQPRGEQLEPRLDLEGHPCARTRSWVD